MPQRDAPQQAAPLALSAKQCAAMRTRSVLVGAPTVFPNPMALSCQAVGPASKAGPKSLESPAGVGSIVFLYKLFLSLIVLLKELLKKDNS